ncbi:MAG: putative polymerase sigma factor [Chlamydiales bacterium]|jgi:RNA polymerase sigma factor for flagellar operon FliA|nr:putative polymerase sigma factor [Chlamydiales bacterium]
MSKSRQTLDTTQNHRLGDEEVRSVWAEYHSSGDRQLREKLILNYLHLVKYVVGRLAATLPSHVKADDLYSTGIIGLVKAIEKFNPVMKNKFETYAILLIKGAIIDEMRALDWVPRSVHQKANQISRAQTELRNRLGRDPSDAETAEMIGVPAADFGQLLQRVQPAILLPLNMDKNDDPDQVPLEERLADEKAKTSFETADYNEFRKLLEKAVMEMPEQERMVLVFYYYENLMLREIGQLMGISESRVSQIHSKAILRLRGRLQSFIKEYADFVS